MPNTTVSNKQIPISNKTGARGRNATTEDYLARARAATHKKPAAQKDAQASKREPSTENAPRKVELVKSDVLATLMEKSNKLLLEKCQPYLSNVVTTFYLIAMEIMKKVDAAKAEGKDYIPNLYVRSNGELKGEAANSFSVFLDKTRVQYDEKHLLKFSANLSTMMMFLTAAGAGYETLLNESPYTDPDGVSHDVYSTRARITSAFGMSLVDAAKFFVEHKPHENKEMSDFYIRRAENIKARRGGDEIENPLGE